MPQVDFLKVQLQQAEEALEATRRLKNIAEQQYRQALDALRQVAISLFAPEWNELKREHPEAGEWTPGQIASWIVATGQARMNRLEIMSRGARTAGENRLEEENRRLKEDNQRLETENRRLREDNQRLETESRRLREDNQRLEQEIRQLQEHLRTRQAQTRPQTQSHDARDDFIQDVEKWQKDADPLQVNILRILGARGLVLRESIAKELGKDPKSSSLVTAFQTLSEAGLITEENAPDETVGRSPRIVRLSGRGRAFFHHIFGLEPVEPEIDRLMARHKSLEQSLLAIQARMVLEEFGAAVDMFPEPISNGHGKFEPDIVATMPDGNRIIVECERATSGRDRRLDKWSTYAAISKDFYFVVPNNPAFSRLSTELNLWAAHRPQDAAGVVLHIHQLSSRHAGGELWHYVRALGGKTK
jgi:hypothetical protein